MTDSVSKLHRDIQQLSVAMFTGLGVTQRDASLNEAVTPPSIADRVGAEESTAVQDGFRESVAELSKEVAVKVRQVLETLEQVSQMEEEAKVLEDSLLGQERDSIATQRLTEEWKESCRLYEHLKRLEKISSGQVFE